MIDFEQELYNRFGQVKDFTLGMRIAKYFYELGSSEKPNNHLEHVPEIKETGTQGLDEAAENYIAPIENDAGLDFINFSGRDIRDAFIAGAKWRDAQIPKLPDNLDEAAKAYATEDAGWNPDGTEKYQIIDEEVDAFKAGAKWQAEQLLKSSPISEDTVLFNKGVEEGKKAMREQMLKEAVEGYITFNLNAHEEGLPDITAMADEKPLEFYEKRGFKLGDKVRIIVLKKED